MHQIPIEDEQELLRSKHRDEKLDLTCNFQCALRSMGDGGSHAYRRITTFLETAWLTQTLRLLQLSFPPWIFTETWRLLSPLAWGLCLETARVITATIELVAGFTILAVPRKSTFHQGALLRISAELERERKGRGTVWGTISHGLCYLWNWLFAAIFVSSQLHSSG